MPSDDDDDTMSISNNAENLTGMMTTPSSNHNGAATQDLSNKRQLNQPNDEEDKDGLLLSNSKNDSDDSSNEEEDSSDDEEGSSDEEISLKEGEFIIEGESSGNEDSPDEKNNASINEEDNEASSLMAAPSASDILKLEQAIETIEQNVESKTLPHLRIHDDAFALSLGQALTKNNCLTRMNLSLASPLVTARGAPAILCGLKASAITTLVLTMEDTDLKNKTWRPVLLLFIKAAIMIMQTVVIQMHAGYDQVLEMEMLLAAASRDNTHLKTLAIQIGDTADMIFHPKQEKRVWKLAKYFDPFNTEHVKLIQQITKGYLLHILFLETVTDNVQELILSFGLEEDDAKLVGLALLGKTNLNVLRIKLGSGLNIDTALQLAKGIHQCSQLIHLDLAGPLRMITSPPEVQKIIYKQGVLKSSTVRELLLRLGMNLTPALSKCLPKLQSFELKCCLEDVTNLLVNLRRASQLCNLRLAPILDANDMNILCKTLPFLPSLTTLSIMGSLTCQEGEQLIRTTGRKYELKYSSLASKNVRATMAERLMIAVASHPSLTDLDLTGSLDIGYLGLEMIGRHLPNCANLETLVLKGLRDTVFNPNNTKVDDIRDEDVKQAFHRAGQAILAGVCSNVNLFEDDVSLPSAIKAEVDFYVKLNDCGRYLLHLDDGVPPEVWCHVMADEEASASVIYYFLREQPQLLVHASDSAVVRDDATIATGTKRRWEV